VDTADTRKRRIAERVLASLVTERRAVTTPQAVSEFLVGTTRTKKERGGPLLTPIEASEWIDAWLDNVECLDLTRTTSREAVRAAVSYGMRVYDAQMWAVAHVYRLPTLVSEDTQFAPVIEGVRYVNPFARSFSLEQFAL
jgi:predicted nucleic acid-binding protein